MNSVTLSFATANVTNAARVVSTGGMGGLGGQGGQGGTGGQGASFTDYVMNSTTQPGVTGGQGGLGFTGGTGGTGGLSTLTNLSAQIAAQSVGLEVISAGGVGGTGGTGGTGGIGGTGGAGVAQTNYVTISISSAGGNGGRAGDAGTGGLGGLGGAAVLINTSAGSIVAGSHAIHAASVGGIGGLGGVGGTGGTGGYGGDRGIFGPQPNYNGIADNAGNGGNAGSAGNGGLGGDGGNGGTVSVTNTQDLSTTGALKSSAILAESLGAIGGQGGTAGVIGQGGDAQPAGTLTYQLTSAGCFGALVSDFFCQVLPYGASASGTTAGAVEGTSGVASVTGGFGGAVTAANAGIVFTVGTSSDAILGLSMGGVYGLDSYDANDVFRLGLPLGAQSGGAGNVTLSNSGEVGTLGNASSAMMGLSIGAGHAAGDVDLSNSNRVTTYGDDAPAMVAASRVLQMGILTGANLGNVTVSNESGFIHAQGAGSTGIWAESMSAIGSAGTVSVNNTDGSLGVGWYDSLGQDALVAGQAIHAVSQGSASSSAVSIVNTRGSIVAGYSAETWAVLGKSVAIAANSGNVSLDNTDGLIKCWSNDIAVYLASLAGQTAGDIDVTSHSTIISLADDSTALKLQSTGGTGSGDITLLNGGLIQGGAGGTAVEIVDGQDNHITNNGALAAEDEEAIIRTGGDQIDAVMDMVISAGIGNDVIDNMNGATIVGSVDLDAGANSFWNQLGSYFLPGATVYLGNGNTLTNDGYLSIGGLNAVMNFPGADISRTGLATYGPTTLTGNFVQNATGQMLTNINFSTSEDLPDFADFLTVTGTATLGGYVTLAPATGAGRLEI